MSELDNNSTVLSRDYLTDEQLAAEMHVSVRTVYRWVALGEAPPYTKIARHRYFRKEAIEKWLKNRECAAVA